MGKCASKPLPATAGACPEPVTLEMEMDRQVPARTSDRSLKLLFEKESESEMEVTTTMSTDTSTDQLKAIPEEPNETFGLLETIVEKPDDDAEDDAGKEGVSAPVQPVLQEDAGESVTAERAPVLEAAGAALELPMTAAATEGEAAIPPECA